MLNLDIDLRPLIPVLKVMSDFSKVLIKDDQRDLAFPTRYHRGMFHHYHWGLIGIPLFDLGMHLIDVIEIVKREKYHRNDTPATFLQRVIAIHNKTYVRPDDETDQDRVTLLTQYLGQLRGEKSKKGIERRLEDAIYMGKIKTKSQLEEELRMRKRRRYPKPPRINKYRASQGKIMLYKPRK
jgi:hypothetical protein